RINTQTMDKHQCKLCLKIFTNGKALGGHMRSHMLHHSSPPSPPSSSSENDADWSRKVTKHTFRQRRSKRIRRPEEQSSLSSISNTSPEEDVAFCLMLLSRDTWSDMDDIESKNSTRSKFRCKTCVFHKFSMVRNRGHKASHKKMKLNHGDNDHKTKIVLSGDIKERTGKQPVVDLDEDHEDDKMASRRSITRWNYNEEILLAESWIEHSQDAYIGKDQHEDIYWNLIMSDFNSRTTTSPRIKNMMTEKWTRMHGDCQRFNVIYKHLNRKSDESDADLVENVKTTYIDRYEVFGPDPKERPIGKQRAKKKQKSVETTSAGGSIGGSAGGSQSESVLSLVSQDCRRKCDAAEKAYEAKREKELAIMQCKELEFLMIDPSSLPPAKRAIIERKQAEIMRKYQDA
nr:zinc finger protein ZAT1-like [Tanacetum cinerariifolium]